MALERRRVYYFGHVQGVGFRYTAQRLARPFGVSGYARNLPDGRVEVMAQGESTALDAFLDSVSREMRDKIRDIDVDRLEIDPDLAADFGIRA